MSAVTVPVAVYVPLVVLAVFGLVWLVTGVRDLRRHVLAARRRDEAAATAAAERAEERERLLTDVDAATAELVEVTEAARRELGRAVGRVAP